MAFGHAIRPPRKNDALRRERTNEVVVDVVRMDFAVDVQLPQTTRDQLRVLGSEIQNQKATVLDLGPHAPGAAGRSEELETRMVRRHELEIIGRLAVRDGQFRWRLITVDAGIEGTKAEGMVG